MSNRANFLKTIAIAIILPSFFAIYSCNGCNNPANESTTTDSMSTSTTDSSMMMKDNTNVQADTMPTTDTSGGKGDQTVPPPKKP